MSREDMVRKFRKALDMSVDGIVEAMMEQDLPDPASLEADIVVRFPGTDTEIRSRPRIEPDTPEPSRYAEVVG